MYTKATEPFAGWAVPGTEAFRFWVSLWPTAPIFGETWIFAEMARDVTKASTESVDNAIDAATAVASETLRDAEAAIEAPVVALEAIAEETLDLQSVNITEEDTAEPVELIEVEAPVANVVEFAAPKAVEPEMIAETVAAEAVETPAVTAPANLFAAAPAAADDLKQIKGIGPSLERQLNGLGIYTLEQLSGYSEAELTWIDDNLNSFKGRCFRDDWVGQAKALLG